MPQTMPAATFGDMLKYLRRRARLTQRELALAVGYTEAHVCRLEKNERLPDVTTVAALFVPALDLEDNPALMERFLKLAALSRDERMPQSVTVSQIIIEHQVEQDLGALEEIPTPLPHSIPRPLALERLRSTLARDGRVALCGLAGMGKTELAATIACERASAEPVFWLTFTEGITTPVETIVRQLALFVLAHGQTQARPLADRRADAAPMPLDQQLALIGAALTALRPRALLCFDDVHLLHGDGASMTLLRHLSAATPARLLLISREDVPLPNVTHINLAGLERDEARAMIERFGLALSPHLAERLLDKTGGSPMLLRLAAGQLLDSHTDAATFIEHLETQSQVSSYLLRVVLRDLSPATQWLAALISVFRQPVDLYDETLDELIQQSDQPCCLDDALIELQQRHLIDDVRRAALHPLVKDHLYAMLATDARRKKRLHRLAAEWSERALGDVVEAAYHWTRAGDVAQAAEIIGDRAEELFNRGQAQTAVVVVDEALNQLRRKHGDTTRLRCRLLTARGDLLRATFRAADAETSYREALSLAQSIPAVRAQIARSLAQSLLQRGQAAEALKLCQSAMAELTSSDMVLLARLAAIECRAHLVLSRFDEAERSAEYAIALAAQFAEVMPQLADEVRARAERTLGWVNYTRHPQGAESLQHYHRALDYARRAGLRVIESAVRSNMATALMERGDLDGALEAYQVALEGFEAMGDVYSVAAVTHNLGMLHHLRGEPALALRRFEQASALEERVGDREGLLSSEEAHASVLLEIGQLAEARVVLDRVLAQDTGSSDTWTLGTCLCLLVEVQLLQGELDAAHSTAQRVLAMTGIEDNARIRAWAQSGLALVHLAAGEIKAAQRQMSVALPEDVGLELTFRWQLVQSLILLARGDADGAQAGARAVIERANQMGYKQAILPAERILAHPTLSVAELPRLLLIGDR